MTTTTPGYLGRAPSPNARRRRRRRWACSSRVSASHMLNDTMQSLAPALYPVFREKMALTSSRPASITFVFQISASLLQPLIGLAADRRPMHTSCSGRHGRSRWPAWSGWRSPEPIRCCSMAVASSGSAARSSIRRPRGSRAPPRAGGTASPRACSRSAAISASRPGRCSQPSSSCRSASIRCSPSPRWRGIAVALLTGVSRWHKDQRAREEARRGAAGPTHPPATVFWTITALIILLFSKVLYIVEPQQLLHVLPDEPFGVSVQTSQILLFVFLASVAVGTLFGGPLDRPVRRQDGHLGIDLRRPAVHPAAAASRACRHGGQLDRHWPRPVFGLLCDRGLCAGADAGECGGCRRPVLRPVVRARGHRRGVSGHARRLYEPPGSSTRSAPSCRPLASSPPSCRTRVRRKPERRRGRGNDPRWGCASGRLTRRPNSPFACLLTTSFTLYSGHCSPETELGCRAPLYPIEVYVLLARPRTVIVCACGLNTGSTRQIAIFSRRRLHDCSPNRPPIILAAFGSLILSGPG